MTTAASAPLIDEQMPRFDEFEHIVGALLFLRGVPGLLAGRHPRRSPGRLTLEAMSAGGFLWLIRIALLRAVAHEARGRTR